MLKKDRQSKGLRVAGLSVGFVPTALLLAFGMEVQAQEEGGSLATFGLTFGGEYRANDPDEDESSFSTGLGFKLSSVTDVQSFVLAADGNFVLDEDEGGLSFENPAFALDYARENRSTAFDIGLSYSSMDVDGEVDVIDPVTGVLIDQQEDDGTRESFAVDVGIATGRDAPFGTETRIRYTDRSYSGTSDPDLTDLESWQIGTTLRFDVEPRINLRSSVSYRVTQEDSLLETEDRTARFSLGGTFLFDRLWSVSAEVNYSIFETEEILFGNSVVTQEERPGFSLSVTRQLRDGILGLSLEREVLDIGERDRVSIFRDREMANGELTWSLGVISFPGGETSPIVSASYARPMPQGSFSIGLAQTAAINGDNEDVLRTAVEFDFDQTINARSSWSLTGSWTNIDILSGDTEDSTRTVLGVAYNYALTRDWDLSASLRHRVRDEDERASIFSVSLDRSFSFRP